MVFEKEAKVGDRIIMKGDLGDYSFKKGTIVEIVFSSNKRYMIHKVLLPELDKNHHYNFYRDRFDITSKLNYHYVI